MRGRSHPSRGDTSTVPSGRPAGTCARSGAGWAVLHGGASGGGVVTPNAAALVARKAATMALFNMIRSRLKSRHIVESAG